MKHSKPLIIAHRGAAGEAPENTLASFQLALQQGCDGLEMDIHLSIDGEIIVCHDSTINRTTDGIGAIHEMTVGEIKRYDAGGWFHEKFAGERIPLLEEVFDLIPPRIMLNIEIKNNQSAQILERLIELLRRRNRMNHTVVSSFNYKCLYDLKRLEPSVKIGLLYDGNVDHPVLSELADRDVYSLHAQYKYINKEYVANLASLGYAVYPWTINDAESMRKAIDAGVSGIITDFPARLKPLIQ